MLTRISNTPRDYAWGSTTLIAELEGRSPSGRPEAEVWFGDHPGSPSEVHDGTGRTLDDWLPAEAAADDGAARLPYLLKLLAAGAPLSIQVHPSKAQAEAGFAREEAAGVPREAGERNYRDDNHKPEVIVALSDPFVALAGLRDLEATRRLVDGLGADAATLRAHLEGTDAGEALRSTIGWLLGGDAQVDVDRIIGAAASASSDEFAAELALSARLAEAYPGDPGVVVALLMNLVSLRPGEAVFVPAGVLHAYVAGLGVELMAASDNVLRGGLTPKHIDVAELLSLVDAAPSPPPRLAPVALEAGAELFDAGVPDFALLHVEATAAPIHAALRGTAIALATRGTVRVTGASGESIELSPGQAVLATVDEAPLAVVGLGELFIAMPGEV
ncbi:mannose-6-phosphate isomerase type 1 [Microbacterium sp. AG1240]|uniref:mannose-6-phosphate isomerase, class I n=1 Tax=Microbacterium sp. AG1240 TaxID=2183992 RepID=UPI000EB5C7ED|nr:mannose-6-phosphate isomerase, class I [Microbacterium sp. AG1240]RKT36352.1 mannose-6-phosphate isomerase type 1 [Microbacterium sp. AG1240]